MKALGVIAIALLAFALGVGGTLFWMRRRAKKKADCKCNKKEEVKPKSDVVSPIPPRTVGEALDDAGIVV